MAGPRNMKKAALRASIPPGPSVARTLDFSAPMSKGHWQNTLSCLAMKLTPLQNGLCAHKDTQSQTELTSYSGKVVIYGLGADKDRCCVEEDTVSQVSDQLSRLGPLWNRATELSGQGGFNIHGKSELKLQL